MIEFSTQLLGVLSITLNAQNESGTGGFGTIVAPQLNGQYHQHNVAVRIDAEIDGNVNTVSTLDVVPLNDPIGSPRNPYGQGFIGQETLLSTPAQAKTCTNATTGRTWLIRNPSNIHPYTKRPVAWKLVPYNSLLPFIRQDSPLHPRSAFADYNMWVTKYKEGQLYPGGFYLNATGLPEWVKEDPHADLTRTDVVLWYVFAFVHFPRVEDWPTMPVE